jgi:uncharacterized protein
MSFTVLIAISFSLGFFVESIVGFGGGLIAYAILSFVTDLKTMILVGLYIGTCSSLYITCSDLKSFDKKIFKNLLLPCFTGTIFGVFVFSKFSSEALSLIFGILLISLAVKIMFFESFTFPKIFKQKLLLIGGISQGAFGTGGPFVANALKDEFKTKSNFRTTLAVFFVIFNLVRLVQLLAQGEIKLNFFYEIWWTIIPVFLAIWLGYKIHLKISENFFKKLIALMTILAGLKFLLIAF